MVKSLTFNVGGTPVKVYPILIDTLNYLYSQRAGVRYEKKLAPKDVKKLITGEITLEDYQSIKTEHDKAKTEITAKEKEEKPMEEMASEVDEETTSYASRGRGRPAKRRKVKEIYCCRVCNSYRLRVVDYGRADGLNMLECANRKCLASIELTDKPAGAIIEAPVDSKVNCGWMMDSIWNNRYPKISRIESGELSANPEIPDLEGNNDDIVQYIRCPGQTEMVKTM